MDIPYLTPEMLKRIGISAGVYAFAFVSFFFLSDTSTASSLGAIFSSIAAAVAVNLLSLDFDRLDVLVTSGSMVPLFFLLEYAAFVELYSPAGVVLSAVKNVLLYAGFSLITATLVLYRMKPEARMRLVKEKEERRPRKQEVFYAPESKVKEKKPDVSLITGKEPAKKEPEKEKPAEGEKFAALEELEKEVEKPVKKQEKLSPELEKAGFRIHGLIEKGKGKEEVLSVLQKAGFSKKEAQRIYDYAAGL